jgi:hypothetical protein
MPSATSALLIRSQGIEKRWYHLRDGVFSWYDLTELGQVDLSRLILLSTPSSESESSRLGESKDGLCGGDHGLLYLSRPPANV